MKTKAVTSIMMLLFLANILVVAIPVQASNTFKVSPSGGDDTANIQNAFDAAVAAGPESIVELEAGTFYLSRPIVVVNFDGHFKGAGKDVTIVQDFGHGPFPLTEPPLEPMPCLFAFYRDANGVPSPHIKFSDMTIRATGKSVPWSWHGFPPIHFFGHLVRVYGKVTGVEDFEVSCVSTSVERMGFEGKVDPSSPFGFSVANGFQVSGENVWELGTKGIGSLLFNYTKPLIGTHTIVDSSFRNLGGSCLFVGLEGSTVEVKSNTFDNILLAFEIYDLSDTFAKFSQNNVENVHWCGVHAVQAEQSVLGLDFDPIPEFLPELSTLLVSDNIIHCIEFADGVVLRDYAPMAGETKRLDATISRNTIILDNTWYGGIFGFYAQDVEVKGNYITGTGFAGIYMGVSEDLCAGWKIIGNDVEEVIADIAPIWLGPGTSDCLVVGKGDTYVWDEGTDNKLVNVNEM